MRTGGVAVCGISQFAELARIERPQGESQRLLSVAEIGGVKVLRRISCFCCTSIPSLRAALTDLLDHAVRPLEHLGRHRDADVPRRIEVHD
jgi:hypothetical protein